MVETEKGEMGMKKWMIPVFVAGGAAVVGTAVLGGILILENKPGMKSPGEVAVKVVQAQIIDGDFEELCMLGRYPMIKAVCDLEATDRQTLQCVDQAKEYWNESVQNTMEVLGEMQDYSVVDIELIPVDEEEIEQTKGRYNSVGDKVDTVIDVECEMDISYSEYDGDHQYITIRAIEVDDRWYLDILKSGIPQYLMGAYYELLETGQLSGGLQK